MYPAHVSRGWGVSKQFAEWSKTQHGKGIPASRNEETQPSRRDEGTCF